MYAVYYVLTVSSHKGRSTVTVGFFDDMYVPLVYLPEPSVLYVTVVSAPSSLPSTYRMHSDPNERAHFWLPNSEATSSHELLDSATADRMYIDAGEVVRIRVEADEFYDDEPGPPKATEGVQQAQSESRRPPYTITVSSRCTPCLPTTHILSR